MQRNRASICSQEAAIWRLVQYQYAGVSGPSMQVLVELVADIYWLTDDAVRAAIARMMRENGDGLSTVVSDAVARRKAVA